MSAGDLATALRYWDEAIAEEPLAAGRLVTTGSVLASLIRHGAVAGGEEGEWNVTGRRHSAWDPGRLSWTYDVVRMTEAGPVVVIPGLPEWQAKAVVAILSPPWSD